MFRTRFPAAACSRTLARQLRSFPAWLWPIASIVVAYLLPVHYDGVAKIVPGESSGNFAAGLLNRATGGGNTPSFGGLAPSTVLGLKTPAAFYIEILKSRTVQDRMID